MLASLLSALAAAQSFLGGLWAFLSKPPGSWLLAGTVALCALWYAHHRGYEDGKAACGAKHKAAVQAEIKRQDDLTEVVITRANQTAITDAALDAANKERVIYVKQAAAAEPSGSALCVPTSVADRLRGLE
jgi:hypothetical protein